MAAVRRRLFNLMTALSLLMCALSVVLWAYSFWAALSLHRCDAGVGRAITSDSGKLVYWRDRRYPDQPDFSWHLIRNTPGGWGGAHLAPRSQGRLGFGWVTPQYNLQAWAPWWSLCVAFGLLPGYRLVWTAAGRTDRAIARWRARRKGLCAVCGYDLRATPDRCPQCGRAVARAS
jgi:hypothetical protein